MFVYIYICLGTFSKLERMPTCHVHNALFNDSIQGKNTISQWIEKEINVCSAGENEKEHQKPQRRRKTG